jgi:hypothetical protein
MVLQFWDTNRHWIHQVCPTCRGKWKNMRERIKALDCVELNNWYHLDLDLQGKRRLFAAYRDSYEGLNLYAYAAAHMPDTDKADKKKASEKKNKTDAKKVIKKAIKDKPGKGKALEKEDKPAPEEIDWHRALFSDEECSPTATGSDLEPADRFANSSSTSAPSSSSTPAITTSLGHAAAHTEVALAHDALAAVPNPQITITVTSSVSLNLNIVLNAGTSGPASASSE